VSLIILNEMRGYEFCTNFERGAVSVTE